MIQLIVSAFVERRLGQSSKSYYASSDHEKVMKAKYERAAQYLAIYDLPLDTDLNTLDHLVRQCGLEKKNLNKVDLPVTATDVKHQRKENKNMIERYSRPNGEHLVRRK